MNGLRMCPAAFKQRKDRNPNIKVQHRVLYLACQVPDTPKSSLKPGLVFSILALPEISEGMEDHGLHVYVFLPSPENWGRDLKPLVLSVMPQQTSDPPSPPSDSVSRFPSSCFSSFWKSAVLRYLAYNSDYLNCKTSGFSMFLQSSAIIAKILGITFSSPQNKTLYFLETNYIYIYDTYIVLKQYMESYAV